MLQQRHKPLLSIIALLILVAGFIGVLYLKLLSHWYYQSSVIKEQLTLRSELVNTDLVTYLLPLSQRPLTEICDEQTLDAMRIADYHSYKLHEYGFVKDNYLLCSTSVGILAEPQRQPSPDIVSPDGLIEFTRMSPVGVLPGNEMAMRLKVGNYQAFIKYDSMMSKSVRGVSIKILVHANQQFVPEYAHGTSSHQSLMSQYSTNSVFRIEGNELLAQFCYAIDTCALISSNIWTFLDKKRWMLATSSVILLALMLLLWSKVNDRLNAYFSFSQQVRRGINTSQVICYFQPIICNETGTVSSCEALCRWRDAQGTIHGAFPFINQVIANGQETLLTQTIIEKAVDEFKQADLLSTMKLSVNTFPQDVASGTIKQILVNCLTPSELKHIIVEITEQQTSRESHINVEISKLREVGVKISIDDFGTGHSNLEQLQYLKADYLKIDKGFVLDMLDNELHLRLVEHIIELAEKMELTCIAEGVETLQHQDKINTLNVPYSQGYYHAHPMPIDELTDYLASHQTEQSKR